MRGFAVLARSLLTSWPERKCAQVASCLPRRTRRESSATVNAGIWILVRIQERPVVDPLLFRPILGANTSCGSFPRTSYETRREEYGEVAQYLHACLPADREVGMTGSSSGAGPWRWPGTSVRPRVSPSPRSRGASAVRRRRSRRGTWGCAGVARGPHLARWRPLPHRQSGYGGGRRSPARSWWSSLATTSTDDRLCTQFLVKQQRWPGLADVQDWAMAAARARGAVVTSCQRRIDR
jgi:hypothetical protein